jgi:hypothetical protein
MGYYPSSNGNLLPTFRDNLSVPSEFMGQDSKTTPRTPEDGSEKLSPGTSASNFQYSLHMDPEELSFQVKVFFAVEICAVNRWFKCLPYCATCDKCLPYGATCDNC